MQSLSFETTDHEHSMDYVKHIYDTNFNVARTGNFHLRNRHTHCGAWTSDAVHFGTGGFATQPGGVVTVCRMKAGRVELTAGRETLSIQRGDVFVLADASHALSTSWTDADCTMISVLASTLERVAQESGTPPHRARFALLARHPVTTQAGHRLAQVMEFTERHLADQERSEQVMLDAIGQGLATAVLTTFTNTMVAESSPFRPRTDVPTTVALAQDFIARNAELPIPPADVARYAAVSKRALEMAFREHLSIAPAAYLRRYRLTRVHEALVDASPNAGKSVTQVAARWGFTDLSRFVVHYRYMYGQPPSATLRDTR